MFDCEHQLHLGMFENDTNVILVLLSSAVSMTTSVVCAGLQLQERIFKNPAAHIANQYTVIAHVENSHRGAPSRTANNGIHTCDMHFSISAPPQQMQLHSSALEDDGESLENYLETIRRGLHALKSYFKSRKMPQRHMVP